MARALLLVPHFWDPVCVPLGVCSLKAYADRAGHDVRLYDFNTVSSIIGAKRRYFQEGMKQFPYWKGWYIERNGTEMLATHQIAYLFARHSSRYPDFGAEILNLDGRKEGAFRDDLRLGPFDAIFDELYAEVDGILRDLLTRHRPDVVGCHLNNSTWPGTLFLLRRVKELAPEVRTVVGGPGPFMGVTPKEVETFFAGQEFIDYYVIGEGEERFVEILDNPDLPRRIVDPNAGLSVREAKDRSLRMDDLPVPDYGDLPVSRYLKLSVASARGCPFECSFCAETVFWKGFRKSGNSLVFPAVRALAERYGRQGFYICESLSNQVIQPLTHDTAAAGAGFVYDCYLRADPICTSVDRTRAWRDGGLVRARIGMESASQRILDAMVKMTNPDKMARTLRALADGGVLTSTLWISCFSGESEAEFQETLRFIRENADNIYQADVAVYLHHREGLAQSAATESRWGSHLRYSEDLNRILACWPEVVTNDLTPAERFDRVRRFVTELRTLGIPNPYSIFERRAALDRWSSLGHDLPRLSARERLLFA